MVTILTIKKPSQKRTLPTSMKHEQYYYTSRGWIPLPNQKQRRNYRNSHQPRDRHITEHRSWLQNQLHIQPVPPLADGDPKAEATGVPIPEPYIISAGEISDLGAGGRDRMWKVYTSASGKIIISYNKILRDQN